MKDPTKFVKAIEVFDVRKAILEIIEIVTERAETKEINIKTLFEISEENEFRVKTDAKRLQQVVLNLL